MLQPYAFNQASPVRPDPAIIQPFREEAQRRTLSVELSDLEWGRFIDQLVGHGTITQAHAERVRSVRASVIEAATRALGLPLTQRTASGAVQLAWNVGARYLEVDVLTDGVEWFFRDRSANVIDGNEESVEAVPEALLKRARSLTSG